jgi:hypothetical protein
MIAAVAPVIACDVFVLSKRAMAFIILERMNPSD